MGAKLFRWAEQDESVATSDLTRGVLAWILLLHVLVFEPGPSPGGLLSDDSSPFFLAHVSLLFSGVALLNE